MINEPTLEHYVYYPRRVEGDHSKAIQARRTAFEGELKALLAHLEHLSGRPIPAWEWPQESQDRRVSQRIVRTDWLDNPATGRSYFVEARTYSDLYWLQVGYYQRGEAGPEIFASLHDEAWHPSATDYLLGSSIYLCGIAADQMDDLAAQTLAVYTGDTPGTILLSRLADCCSRLYGMRGRPHVAALLYADAECEAWVGQHILNDIALRLELYKHKADRQLAWCEANWPTLSEQEQDLRDFVEQVREASQSDVELLRRLARLYRVYSGNVGVLAERQETIRINLDNLDAVLEELGPLAEDRLVSSVRNDLRRRQEQLKADLTFADLARQQADATINALKVELGLDRLAGPYVEPDDVTPLESRGFPGAPASTESEIESLTSRTKPSQPRIDPQIEVSPHLRLTTADKALLRQVYRGFARVLVEKEFGGGFSGTRVLLTLPVTTSGLGVARKITKLGAAPELRGERDSFQQYVEDFLPFCVARVESDRYTEQDGQAGLNYVFVGGGALGRAIDLEEYYHRAVSSHAIDQIVRTLDDLLDKELGQHWYRQATPLHCFFAAEYGPHMIEHLRLRLRPESSDALWLEGHSLPPATEYRQIEIQTIPHEHEAIRPDTLLALEGMVVKKIKRGEVKLQDPEGQGIVVRVELAPESNMPQGLKLGSRVGVRGQVIYNRLGRMEQIVCDAFPELLPGVKSELIRLPLCEGAYPNPLRVYPLVLGRILEGRQSYVHGDLHLRNVLVDEGGRGWLIDFAKVGKGHNLYDFIKLETYVRLMALASGGLAFSLCDYIQFEEALADATLGKSATPPREPNLRAAYDVILFIRRMARSYMDRDRFLDEYLPALFLYCLAVMKYHQDDRPQPARLAFATACVLGRYVWGKDEQARPGAPSVEAGSPIPDDQPGASDQRDTRPHQATGVGEPIELVWDMAAIRDLLTAAFSDDELTTFCFDHFRSVHEQFSTGMSKRLKIQWLLDHCDRHSQLDKLLRLTEESNPEQYALFATRLRWEPPTSA